MVNISDFVSGFFGVSTRVQSYSKRANSGTLNMKARSFGKACASRLMLTIASWIGSLIVKTTESVVKLASLRNMSPPCFSSVVSSRR